MGMGVFLAYLFHRHCWHVIFMAGDFWSECKSCGRCRLLPFDAVSEIPAGYPVEVREGLADRIAAIPFSKDGEP